MATTFRDTTRTPASGAPTTIAAMTTLFVDVPGGRLHVVDEGSGPAIVLLHAGIAVLEQWDGMAPLLVRAGYRVVRYDTRAFGGSTTDDVPFSNRADLIAVLDSLGIGRAALVGNSRGGQIAFDTAIEYPDRIVAVIGVGAGLSGFDGPATAAELALFDEGDALESADPIDADAVADFDVRVWVDGHGRPGGQGPAWIRDAVRAWDRPQYLPGVVGGEPIPLRPAADARLADLGCPVLAIAGGLDFSEVVATARHLEEAAPVARALIWDDVAHMIGMEQPERLAATILEFVEPLATWS